MVAAFGVWGGYWDLPALSLFLGIPLKGEGHDAVVAEKWQGAQRASEPIAAVQG